MKVCTRCGHEAPPDARFCPVCAAPIESPPEPPRVRKTVTLVFCDVTGSTAMGERLDSEAVRGVMARYFDEARVAIERHGGTVEKYVGDAVMAAFGIPTAHEDDPVRAVRAAADMRDAIVSLSADLGGGAWNRPSGQDRRQYGRGHRRRPLARRRLRLRRSGQRVGLRDERVRIRVAVSARQRLTATARGTLTLGREQRGFRLEQLPPKILFVRPGGEGVLRLKPKGRRRERAVAGALERGARGVATVTVRLGDNVGNHEIEKLTVPVGR